MIRRIECCIICIIMLVIGSKLSTIDWCSVNELTIVAPTNLPVKKCLDLSKGEEVDKLEIFEGPIREIFGGVETVNDNKEPSMFKTGTKCIIEYESDKIILDNNGQLKLRKAYKKYIYSTSYFDIRYGVQKNLPAETQHIIYQYCIKYNVPMPVMMAIFCYESNLNINYGISPSGTYCGIAMLHIEYNRDKILDEIGVDILDPYGNIEAACYIMAQKIKRFNDNITKALIAYNKGDNGARALLARGIYETGYSKRVQELIKGFNEPTIEEFEIFINI